MILDKIQFSSLGLVMNALLITLAIYAIPVFTKGQYWYIQLALSSVLYIILIYHFARIRERVYLIGVEFINLSCIATAFASLYIFQSQNFITSYITDIIQTAFIAEIMIILTGAAIGVRKRDTTMGSNRSDRNKSDYRFSVSFKDFI